MIKKLKNYKHKKGFTLIELIVVMAIIGILVLLAAPRFLGRTEDALVTRIKNDITSAETKVDEYLFEHDDLDKWETSIDTVFLDNFKDDGTLHDREGVMSSEDEVKEGNYSQVPEIFIKETVNSQLDGDFYANDEGEVYYNVTGGSGENVENGDVTDGFEIPDYYVQATDDDFIRVVNDSSPDGEGYWYYNGTAEYVVIPEMIDGNAITDTYYMFGYNSDSYDYSQVQGAASNNPDITNMASMFDNNEYVGIIELDYLNTSSVTDMSDMFYYAYAETITFGEDFTTSNVTDMSGMFRRTSATELDISSFDTSNVTDMSQMFYSADATLLDLSPFNTSNVTDMSQMFYSSDATLLDLSSFDTSKVTDMSQMFRSSSVTLIDLSSFDIKNVTNTNNMFYYTEATSGYARIQEEADRYNDPSQTSIPCNLYFVLEGEPTREEQEQAFLASLPIEYNLATDMDYEKVTDSSAPKNYYWKYIGTDEYVIVPSTIKGDCVTDTYSMFRGNTTVKGVASNNPNVTNMRGMFYELTTATLNVTHLDTSGVTNMDFMFWNSTTPTLDISSFDTSNVTSMRSMFSHSKATTLNVQNINTSKVKDMHSMFSGSPATTLDVSSFNTANATSLSAMFSGAAATTLDLRNFDTSNVTNMRFMFRDIKATTLDVSSFDTSNVSDMEGMFYRAETPTLDLSNFDTSSVYTMEDMFLRTKATTIDVSNFDISSVRRIEQMFYQSNATTLDLSSFDMTNINNVLYMFYQSKATVGYARTTEDAVKLNDQWSERPSGLTFVVK